MSTDGHGTHRVDTTVFGACYCGCHGLRGVPRECSHCDTAREALSNDLSPDLAEADDANPMTDYKNELRTLIAEIHAPELLGDITADELFVLYPELENSYTKLEALLSQHSKKRELEASEAMLYDLDEIDNKPWRVFRQLAKLMPEYADTYKRYEEFYAHGGSRAVEKLIEDFEADQLTNGEEVS